MSQSWSEILYWKNLAVNQTIKYYPVFRRAIPDFKECYPCITDPFAAITNNQSAEASKLKVIARLAYLRHAANVHPEPWSNSHWKIVKLFSRITSYRIWNSINELTFLSLFSFQRSQSLCYLRANLHSLGDSPKYTTFLYLCQRFFWNFLFCIH